MTFCELELKMFGGQKRLQLNKSKLPSFALVASMAMMSMAGCATGSSGHEEKNSAPVVETRTAPAAVEAPARMHESPNADNSAVNVRDRSSDELTADQQTSGKDDVEITRKIRRALTKDNSLSIYAHNIKIITLGGVVTLKGPVKTEEEKMKAETTAKSIAGVSKINNELSVKR